MLTDCSGRPLSTASVVLLWCNVVSNIYNLVIISLIGKSEIRVLLNDYSDVKQSIIMIQTVVSICAIMICTVRKTSCLIFSLKFWAFGSTLVLLFLDIMQSCIIAFDLLSHEKTLNAFWKIKTHSLESVVPDNLYFTAVFVFTIYFVFKFYVAYTILHIGKKFYDDLFNDEYFLDQNVARNTPSDQTVSLELPPSDDQPPSYDQCVKEYTSMPPPSYNVVQKY